MSIVSSTQKTLFQGTLNLTATIYTYTETGDTDIDSGWHNAKYTDCVVQIGAGTLTNPIFYRVEGRFTNSDRNASIAVGNISAANIDKLIAVGNLKTPEVRVGVMVATPAASPTDAPHTVYCKLLFTDQR